jgi:30S ribosomal protein 3|tara:strand:- start:83 stop:394 length:312 start_codon:yes stop_codon:yes gene_type:complete
MQKLNLQVLWLDDSLGLAVNQQTSGGIFPLTPYYFWPISEAWEQIKFELDSKPWITEEERVNLLNSVVKVMNEWQQSRNNPNETVNNQNGVLELTNITISGAS